MNKEQMINEIATLTSAKGVLDIAGMDKEFSSDQLKGILTVVKAGDDVDELDKFFAKTVVPNSQDDSIETVGRLVGIDIGYRSSDEQSKLMVSLVFQDRDTKKFIKALASIFVTHKFVDATAKTKDLYGKQQQFREDGEFIPVGILNTKGTLITTGETDLKEENDYLFSYFKREKGKIFIDASGNKVEPKTSGYQLTDFQDIGKIEIDAETISNKASKMAQDRAKKDLEELGIQYTPSDLLALERDIFNRLVGK